MRLTGSFQYLVPVLIPLALALLASPFVAVDPSLPHRLDPVPTIAIEGGKWAHELHSVVAPTCQHNLTTTAYKGKTRTGFVSFPRSGNSMLRTLVERATGYQTSSICQYSLFDLEIFRLIRGMGRL
jgi:hypothetical protein